MSDVRNKTAGPGTTYRRVPTQDVRRRSYTITMGLIPGYTVVLGQLDKQNAVAAHHQWMTDRIRRDLPYLTGIFTDGLLSYAWPRPDTTDANVRTEPVVTFSGEVSVLYASKVPDATVADMLDDLAAVLAGALGQVRVYVTYLDEAWVIEATDEPVSDQDDFPPGCVCSIRDDLDRGEHYVPPAEGCPVHRPGGSGCLT